MLRRIYAKLLVVSLCFVLFTSVINDFTQTVEAASSTPKNIIFMIGDGMGPNQILMAEQAKGSPLHMQNMPYKGVHSTSTVTGAVTDSAAAATALACGVKTIKGFVGVNRNGQPLPNIREYCADLGKKTGLVTNTSITDATPAGFGAHTLSRTNHEDIAEQYIQKEIDLLIGGGAKHFKTDLRNTATQKGYTVITQKNEFMNTNATKMLALFASDNMAYETERNQSVEPSLVEMTQKSISILSKHSKGFFLMVEGGRIDHAGHLPDDDPTKDDPTKMEKNIAETLEFDKAVKAALDFAALDGNTLVIVTADHETGGLQKSGETFTFTSTLHTGVDVPYYTYGVGASSFTGNLINTSFYGIIKQLLDASNSATTTSSATSASPTQGQTSVSNTNDSGAGSTVTNTAENNNSEDTNTDTDDITSTDAESSITENGGTTGTTDQTTNEPVNKPNEGGSPILIIIVASAIAVLGGAGGFVFYKFKLKK